MKAFKVVLCTNYSSVRVMVTNSHHSLHDHTPTSIVISDLQVSDHSLVTFRIPFCKPSVQMKTFTRRQWSKFDASQFELELAASELATTDSTDVDYLFQLYDDTIRTLLDKHAPPTTVRRRLRPESPWFDAECHQAKKEVSSLSTIIRHRQSVTGSGEMRWFNTTSFCD